MNKLEEFPNGLKIYQLDDSYKFTSDSVFLAKFCKIAGKDNVIELCAGSGIVGFYAYDLHKFNSITFCEIQEKFAKLIQKNIELNNLQNAKVINSNLIDIKESNFDVVICNPPYFSLDGKQNKNEDDYIARHEVYCTFEDIARTVKRILKFGGKFYLIHNANRLSEIICTLERYNLRVKRLKFLYGKNKADTVLIEAKLGGKSGCIVEKL